MKEHRRLPTSKASGYFYILESLSNNSRVTPKNGLLTYDDDEHESKESTKVTVTQTSFWRWFRIPRTCHQCVVHLGREALLGL